MIAADTGNNRLQVFHTEILANPDDDPGIQAASTSGSSGGRGYEGLSPPPSVDGAPVDNAMDSCSGSPVAWARSQAPPPTKTSSGQGRKSSSAQVDAVGRRPGVRKPHEEKSATGPSLGEVGDDSSRDCLLVFTGGGGVGRLRKRRTAGESEAAEGPMCQPCDLAYWRARQPGRGVEGHATTCAWTAELPRWFRPRSCHGSRDSSVTDVNDEEDARRALLSPVLPSQNVSTPSRGDKNRDESRVPKYESTGNIRGFVGDVVGGGKPLLGSFVVRETGLQEKLQLLFVAKTKVR